MAVRGVATISPIKPNGAARTVCESIVSADGSKIVLFWMHGAVTFPPTSASQKKQGDPGSQGWRLIHARTFLRSASPMSCAKARLISSLEMTAPRVGPTATPRQFRSGTSHIEGFARCGLSTSVSNHGRRIVRHLRICRSTQARGPSSMRPSQLPYGQLKREVRWNPMSGADD